MAQNTKIEWAHDTVNFWWGCLEVSPACDFCYARELDARYKFGGATHWGPAESKGDLAGVQRWERVEKAAGEIKKNNKLAIKTGARRRQFVNSMSDFFEDREELDDYRLAALDAFALADRLDILLLTKRASRIMPILERMLKDARHLRRRSPGFDVLTDWVVDGVPPANIWLGTTCENQKWLDLRLPHLLSVPARIRFISAQPLLGSLDLQGPFNAWWNVIEGTRSQTWPSLKDYLHWVICGGESDWKRPSRARPMHPTWAISLLRQCQSARVSFHFKQWGDWGPAPMVDPQRTSSAEISLSLDGIDAGQPHRTVKISDARMFRIGNKNAGRLLYGREWNEVPEVQIV